MLQFAAPSKTMKSKLNNFWQKQSSVAGSFIMKLKLNRSIGLPAVED
jgi:hypothetical protein